MKAWYFANKGNRLAYGDKRLVRVGVTHKVDVNPKLCHQGLHASERIIDALSYANYHILYLVELGGKKDIGRGKIAAQSRKYIARYDMEEILFEFSRWAARQTIHLAEPYFKKEDYALVVKWLDTGDKKTRDAADAADAASAAWDAASAAWAADAVWAADAAWAASAASAVWAAARAVWAADAADAADAASAVWAAARAVWAADAADAASAVWAAASAAAWAARAASAVWADGAAQEEKLIQMIKDKYGDIE